MENVDIKKLFFEPVTLPSPHGLDYSQFESLSGVLNQVSQLENKSIYIIDYARQDFLYVSPHPLFLCGYSSEEVKALGYDFYKKVIPPEDLFMLLNINRAGWNMFDKMTGAGKLGFCISYDFYLCHKNGSKVLVSQKLSPVCLTKDSKIWLAICTVGYSCRKEPGNVVIKWDNVEGYFTYDAETKKIIPQYPEALSSREKEIILLIMRGFSILEIAQRLSIAESTVRTHRSKIEKKLGVKNLANAVSMFQSQFS